MRATGEPGRRRRPARLRRAWPGALALASVLLAGACGGERTEGVRSEAPVARGVRVVRAAVQPVDEILEAVGTVRSKTQTQIASKVQGLARLVQAREGDLVEAGRLLVVIDDRELTARAARAEAALAERGQLTGVYVVDDRSVARPRLVTAGQRRAEQVEILSGLAPGEQVVTEGVERVTDGGRVETAS
jgi:multidrug efflux pump subunit AcrA (membrane-fusion protein)